jgi:predicted nucleic acid-binding protein
MIFVDTSAWFAAVNRRDRHHRRATELLVSDTPLVTSDLVIVETWLLTNSRIDFRTAEHFVRGVTNGSCQIVRISEDDWRKSSTIPSHFSDQKFSIVDRTSFAVMERLNITRAVSFDDDFIIHRYGQNLVQAFEMLR